MSRSNPAKKKRRVAKITILIYGEGASEERFLKYLRQLYACNNGAAVTIRQGKGGSADGLISSAKQFAGSFAKRVVVLDADKDEQEMHRAEKLAKGAKIDLLKSVPCLEATLLFILKGTKGTNFAIQTSKWCKQQFSKECRPRQKPLEKEAHQKLFPKRLLDSRKKTIAVLAKLISLMKGVS